MQNEQDVVAMVTLNVTDRTFQAVAQKAGETLQRTISQLQGFIEGTVLTNEDKSRIVLLTKWQSRDMWAKAEWDNVVGHAVAELLEDSASYNLEFFFPLVDAGSNRMT